MDTIQRIGFVGSVAGCRPRCCVAVRRGRHCEQIAGHGQTASADNRASQHASARREQIRDTGAGCGDDIERSCGGETVAVDRGRKTPDRKLLSLHHFRGRRCEAHHGATFRAGSFYGHRETSRGVGERRAGLQNHIGALSHNHPTKPRRRQNIELHDLYSTDND